MKKVMKQNVNSDVSDIGGALSYVSQTQGNVMPNKKVMAPKDPKAMKGYQSLGTVPIKGLKKDNRGEGT